MKPLWLESGLHALLYQARLQHVEVDAGLVGQIKKSRVLPTERFEVRARHDVDRAAVERTDDALRRQETCRKQRVHHLRRCWTITASDGGRWV